MKKIIVSLLTAALALGAVCLSACGENDGKSSSADKSESQQSSVTDAPTIDELEEQEVDLMSLHSITVENPDDFAGSWQISDGEGSQYKSFVYMFDGKENSYLMIGSTGQCAKYSVENETDKSGVTREIFSSQMMFGINGKYTFEFTDEKQTLTLTNIEDSSVTVLKKLATYEYIPIPPQDVKTDDELIGAWKGDDGEYLYFDKSGIMYDTMRNINFHFCTYNAENGKISYSYAYTDSKQVEEAATYSVSGETLTYNNAEFKKIPASELV